MEDDLDKEFETAFIKISDLEQAIAPDIMLKFYAYYKQANFGNNFSFGNNMGIRSAFKFNAWVQLRGMSSKDAKKEYIKLANTIFEKQ